MVSNKKEGVNADHCGNTFIDYKKPEPESGKPGCKKKGISDTKRNKTAHNKRENAVFIEIIAHFFQGFYRNYPCKNIEF
jgi:hypothetical protein